ncbi:bluetail domain-containing putative surface protein [Microcystis sp. LEGE 08355]|uniref:bluetail domain-containing putative surface protein n=1 Tax=Microcystis sp. LEGE 08355 TaxID=1828687 RepID=UPI00188171ED|nr:bluetail domain-containing putative surface protein [Microcystis sp. LEGE 08355]MBE9071815.1 DUF4214 domain-containing protein [Microcystis sp. LEGE 08355]
MPTVNPLDLNTSVGLYVIYFGRATSSSDLNNAVAAGQAGVTNVDLAIQFGSSQEAKTKYPFLQSPLLGNVDEFINQIYQNMFARNADADGLAFWRTQLLAAQGSPQAVALFILDVAQGAKPDSDDFKALQNKADVALDFSKQALNKGVNFDSTLAQSSANNIATVNSTQATRDAAIAQNTVIIAGSGGGGGQTFVFTTALDNLAGTPGNDTFNGDNSGGLAQQTVQLGDVANGGEGTDTFNYFGPTNNVLPQLSNIENVNLIQGAGGAFDFSAAAGKGLKSVTVDTLVLDPVPPTLTTIQGIGGVGLTLKGNFNNNNLTADFGNSATEAQIGTNAVDKGGTLTVRGNKLTTLNFTATGSSKFAGLVTTALDAGAVNTIKVSGDGKSLSFSDSVAVANSIKTIDASGLTAGGLTVAFGTGITSFKGGKGDDIVRSNTLTTTTDSAVDAGEGTKDRLIVNNTVNVNTTARANVYANFEVLQSDGQQVDLDLFAKSAFVALRAAGASVFNNVTATQAGDVTIFGNATPTFNLKTATGTSDTLNITVSDGLEAVNNLTITNLTAPNVEILKFTTTDNTTVNTLVNAPAASTITATGAGTFTLTTNNRPLGTGFSIDASAVTANVTIDASAGTGNGAIIKGASSSPAAVNTLFGSAQNDIIAAGSGSDLLDGNAGQDTLTGGVGVDQFIYDGGFASNVGTANVDRITDFVAGVGGDQFKFATGANNFINGRNFAAATTVNINDPKTIATAANINDVFAGITAIAASTDATLQAVLVTVSAGLAAGTYLYANDGTGAVSNADDFLVNVSGITGTLSVTPTTGNFIFG